MAWRHKAVAVDVAAFAFISALLAALCQYSFYR